MTLDWSELEINQTQLDNILELDLSSSWAIALNRVFLLHQAKYWQSLLFIESSILFTSLLFWFPINLIVFRKLNLLDADSSGLLVVLLGSFSLAILFLIVTNYSLWQKAKKLKSLTKLLNKITEYNRLVNDFQLISNFNKLTSSQHPTADKSVKKLQNIFKLTKNSLLQSIELEVFMTRHRQAKQLISSQTRERDRLLANLEQNLVNVSLIEIDSNQEYQQLLNEAVELGLNVHREIDKIKYSRRSL